MKKHTIFTFVFILAFSIFSHLVNAQTVYVTPSGKKYHKKNCSVVSEGKKGIELSEAKKQGLEPCAVCKPETEVTAPAKKEKAPADKPKKK